MPFIAVCRRRPVAWRALLTAAAAAVSLAPFQAAQGPAPESAEWVARQVDARDTGRDSELTMTMRLTDRQGRARDRSLVITSLRGSGSRGDRVLVRFLAPADIRGTGFLVWEHAAQDDERFLYLPALGRVRRIAGAEAQESFVGSDLSYEDIGGRRLSDYTYRMVDAAATWTDAEGRAHPAWRIESVRRPATRVTRPRGRSSVRTRSSWWVPRCSTGAANARRCTRWRGWSGRPASGR